jgi:hypothetical protein
MVKVSQSSFERYLRQACDEKKKFKRDLVHRENEQFVYSAGDLASIHGETDFARAYREGMETTEEKKYAIAYASKALVKLRPIMLPLSSNASQSGMTTLFGGLQLKGNDNGDGSAMSVDTQYKIPSIVVSKAAIKGNGNGDVSVMSVDNTTFHLLLPQRQHLRWNLLVQNFRIYNPSSKSVICSETTSKNLVYTMISTMR